MKAKSFDPTEHEQRLTGEGRRYRVVHIGKFYSPHVGGMESHLQLLCAGLRKSTDLSVVVANDGREDEESVIDGVPVSRHGTRFNLTGVAVCPSMVGKLKKIEVDLIHVHLPNPIAVLAVLVSGQKARIVATWHSDVVRQKRLAKLFLPIQRRFLRRCNKIIATSGAYVDSSDELKFFTPRCKVIPYGIDIEQYRHVDSTAVNAILRRHGPRIVLTVGRLVYYKGFEHLISAMRHIDGELVIIGDGPLRRSLQQRSQALGVADKVTFVGEMQPGDIGPYYQACDVFVLPSVARSEAFGIVQLEAMACGKPVVNTQIVSGAPFVSIHGVTGVTVQPADSDALAKGINLLLENDELRERYGQAALRRVNTEFSHKKMVEETLGVYSEVIDGSVLTGTR